MRLILSTVVFVFCICFYLNTALAAQSTADVPASSGMKQSMRDKVMGGSSRQPVEDEEYTIGYGDVLSVSVFGEGDMSPSAVIPPVREGEETDVTRMATEGVRVMIDGRVSLLHIGDVQVVGMTLTQLADYLKSLYATIYSDPVITTTLVQSNSLKYTVMGNVVSPGIYHLDYPLTIVQTIARSGGFTEWANKNITVVRETVSDSDKGIFKGNSLKFDYDNFVSGKDIGKNISIKSGDTVIVH